MLQYRQFATLTVRADGATYDQVVWAFDETQVVEVLTTYWSMPDPLWMRIVEI